MEVTSLLLLSCIVHIIIKKKSNEKILSLLCCSMRWKNFLWTRYFKNGLTKRPKFFSLSSESCIAGSYGKPLPYFFSFFCYNEKLLLKPVAWYVKHTAAIFHWMLLYFTERQHWRGNSYGKNAANSNFLNFSYFFYFIHYLNYFFSTEQSSRN